MEMTPYQYYFIFKQRETYYQNWDMGYRIISGKEVGIGVPFDWEGNIPVNPYKQVDREGYH